MAKPANRRRMGFFSKICASGQRFSSGSHTIDEAQIKAFAAQFDPQPFHLDGEAAKANVVRRIGGERLAHRCDHDEVTRRIRPAAARRNHRERWRDQLAQADAARRHAHAWSAKSKR